MKKWHKTTLVILGAIVFSTVAIQASDVLRNIDGGLTGSLMESEGVCGAGSVQVMLSTGALCVDAYEASANEACAIPSPQNDAETQNNINDFECAAASAPAITPWRFVSLSQAQQLCARTGKRLPTNDEWHALAVGVGDQSSCVIDSDGVGQTGVSSCVTQSGIHDLIGNVWEWIDGEVYDGQYKNRPLPESGYVSMVDSDGVVIETSSGEVPEYGADYASTNLTGARGILRGGYYGSGSDAGIYAQNITVSLDFKAPGVGFRCVKSL